MPSTQLYYRRPTFDVQAKQRPFGVVVMDLHKLGIHELEGLPTPQLIPVPPAEPGDVFEIVLVNGFPMLHPLDGARPSLLPSPCIEIYDSAGDQGEIAAAVLLDG